MCANMLEDCTKIKALLLKLKESLRRDKAATRLQAATRGFLARRQARAALALPLSAAAAQQQLQDGVSVDQLACHEALVVADPAPARIRSRLRPALPQLPVRTPYGVSVVCLAFPAGADQLQLLGMHLHRKTKKSGSPGHAAMPRRRPPRARMRLEPWPPPDHHSSRASCLQRREEMSCAKVTVHYVNSNRVQILGKIRLDWFVISLN